MTEPELFQIPEDEMMHQTRVQTHHQRFSNPDFFCVHKINVCHLDFANLIDETKWAFIYASYYRVSQLCAIRLEEEKNSMKGR